MIDYKYETTDKITNNESARNDDVELAEAQKLTVRKGSE
jgi:hypothetical protein